MRQLPCKADYLVAIEALRMFVDRKLKQQANTVRADEVWNAALIRDAEDAIRKFEPLTW